MEKLTNEETQKERERVCVDHVEGKRKKIWGNWPMKRLWEGEGVDYVESKKKKHNKKLNNGKNVSNRERGRFGQIVIEKEDNIKRGQSWPYRE